MRNRSAGKPTITPNTAPTHAATGIHTARQDSTPLLMLVGQVARNERGRESFQELDYEAVFGSMAKWAFEIDDPERIPELLARAYTEATSGRPGPVVLALPEDVLAAEVDVEDAPRYRALRPADPGRPEALSEQRHAANLERMLRSVREAEAVRADVKSKFGSRGKLVEAIQPQRDTSRQPST